MRKPDPHILAGFGNAERAGPLTSYQPSSSMNTKKTTAINVAVGLLALLI